MQSDNSHQSCEVIYPDDSMDDSEFLLYISNKYSYMVLCEASNIFKTDPTTAYPMLYLPSGITHQERKRLCEECFRISNNFKNEHINRINRKIEKYELKPLTRSQFDEYDYLSSEEIDTRFDKIRSELSVLFKLTSQLYDQSVTNKNGVIFWKQDTGYLEKPTDMITFDFAGSPVEIINSRREKINMVIDNGRVLTDSVNYMDSWVDYLICENILCRLKQLLGYSIVSSEMSEDLMLNIFPANFPDVPPIMFSATKANYCNDVIGKYITVSLSPSQVDQVGRVISGEKIAVFEEDIVPVRSALNEILICGVSVD